MYLLKKTCYFLLFSTQHLVRHGQLGFVFAAAQRNRNARELRRFKDNLQCCFYKILWASNADSQTVSPLIFVLVLRFFLCAQTTSLGSAGVLQALHRLSIIQRRLRHERVQLQAFSSARGGALPGIGDQRARTRLD